MLKHARPFIVLFACLLAVLTGCTDDERAQRQTFITFLQTRVINTAGVRLPKLTEQEKSTFGSFAGQYELIEDFHRSLNEHVGKQMDDVMRQISFRSLRDILDRRVQIDRARLTMSDLGAAIAEAQTAADMAHSRLRQPDDLKVVYDKAYDKTVTQPAKAFKQIIPVVTDTLDTALSIYNYVSQNKDKITITGTTIEINDQEVVDQLNEQLKTLNNQGQELVDAQLRLRKLISGH